MTITLAELARGRAAYMPGAPAVHPGARAGNQIVGLEVRFYAVSIETRIVNPHLALVLKS